MSAHEQRAAGIDAGVIPADAARLLPFPAQMRASAELVDWEGKQRYQLDGVASTVEQPYRMWDQFGEYDEVIDARAFEDTLARDPDVAFLINHRGLTMARTASHLERRSLELVTSPLGLSVRAYLNPDRQDVRDLVHAIHDRDVTEMSFAFRIDEGEWSEDYSQFRIKRVDLNRGDVSAVNYGANPYTSIAARSREVLADLERLPLGAARAALQRLQARKDLAVATVVDLGDVSRETSEPVTVSTGTTTTTGTTTSTDVSRETSALPPSELIPPVQGIPNDQRADLGRSVHLVRLEWLVNSDDDDED